MEKVIKYRCSNFLKLFDTPEVCLEHEKQHEIINNANKMLRDGHSLGEI